MTKNIYLNKITISNARRIGNTVIDLTHGANIILAPNGTGKTTVFEAIEFALTGSIERLIPPPLSLIRDQQEAMQVRLDFTENKFCLVDYAVGGKPFKTGDHSFLFPKHSENEIAGLLRLTHLLEQHGNNWLVQQKDKEVAGKFLDVLSIGKDLTLITKTKQSVTSASTKLISEVKAKVQNSEKEIEAFTKLQISRDAVASNYTLRPLDEILKNILEIYKRITEKIPEIQIQLQHISAFAAQVKSTLINAQNTNDQDIIKISSLENKLTLFKNNKLRILETDKKIIDFTNQLISIEEKLTKLNESFDLSNDQLIINRKKSMELDAATTNIEMRKVANKNLTILKNELIELNKQLPDFKELLKINIEEYNKINSVFQNFKTLKTREEQIQIRLAELKTLEDLLKEWIDLINKFNDIEKNKLPEILQEEKNAKVILAENERELKVGNENFEKSQNNLNNLRNISNEMQTAIGIIAVSMPKDQEDCPVCGAIYEAEILQKKLQNALNSVDPVLKAEIDNNKILSDKLNECRQKVDLTKNALLDIEQRLNENKESVKSFQEKINEKILPRFLETKDYSSSILFVESNKQKLTNELNELKEQKMKAGIEPSDEKINQVFLKKETVQLKLGEVEKDIQKIEIKLNLVNAELDTLNEKLAGIDEETIKKNISETNENISGSLLKIDQNKNLAQAEQLNKINTTKLLSNETNLHNQIISEQNEITAEWLNAKFEGEPDMVTFNIRRESLAKKTLELNENNQQLSNIDEEIAKWKQADSYNTINEQIKTLCGGLPEDDHLLNLNVSLNQIQDNYKLISEKKKVLYALYGNVATETAAVYEYLNSINPLWTSLLKRIVSNPRFAETSFHNYPFRNKSHSSIEISLHESKVNVMDVASEAQLTDLQLTFMLSMAATYQWSPWKALLLDDPTQHHDLVHASNVFDLLRDYIIDQKFQVIVGTHDGVQARFFQRKLQNDGIPVKLWNLTPNETGVVAELL